ncbi:hypothetical protein B7463_g9389, partial [Scytalidium lignicola]
MTRRVEPVNPSPPFSMPLRARLADSAASSTAGIGNGNSNEEYIQKAVSVGKEISGSLGDVLRQSILANNEESHLHQILALADELRSYQSPVEFTIGIIGDSGVGKSSLINSLLDAKLAKTGGTGSACTTVATEYRKKRESDSALYTIEIECMNSDEIEDLLRQSVIDYRRYHVQERESETTDHTQEEQLQIKAKVAWDTLKAAFEDRDGCTEILFQNPNVSTDELQDQVLRWKEDIVWPAGFNAQMTVLEAEEAENCVNQIDQFLRQRIWPFIKLVQIYLDAVVLRNGVVLVDLPGFRDINSARVRITEDRLYKCDEIFVVTEIGRAATNSGVLDLVTRQLGHNFDNLRRSQGVAIICTKSEVEDPQEDEILRDIPQTNTFNQRIIDEYTHRIENAEDNDRPTGHLRAQKKHIFISARNQHVKSRINAYYAAQSRSRNIAVHCVSSYLYRDACIERNRRSGNQSRIMAANQKIEDSGICELRDYCQEIPSMSQILETRHYLHTRLVRLIEKINMWLISGVAGTAALQEAAPTFLNELNEELKFGMNRWEQAALSSLDKLKRWHVATLSSFWNNDGAHSTRAQDYTDWNADMISTMIEDFKPSEEMFRSRNEEIFGSLSNSIHEGLSTLLTKLGELQGVDAFRQTFPRRRRELDYDINNIINSFLEKLQLIVHDLFGSHGTSYVMRHMQPTYNVTESGHGMKQRLLDRLNLRVRGDHDNPRLFKATGDFFISAVESLLEETREKLHRATDRSCEDIKRDLELLRGENVQAQEQADILDTMFAILDHAKNKRDEAEREFESNIVG